MNKTGLFNGNYEEEVKTYQTRNDGLNYRKFGFRK